MPAVVLLVKVSNCLKYLSPQGFLRPKHFYLCCLKWIENVFIKWDKSVNVAKQESMNVKFLTKTDVVRIIGAPVANITILTGLQFTGMH